MIPVREILVAFAVLSVVKADTGLTQSNDSNSQAGKKVCSSIAGVWHNQLGSELTLRVAGQGELDGTFSSVVSLEVANDPATIGNVGSIVGKVLGTVTSDGLFAFHVPWHNGTEVTSWTGQCEACDGKEVLFTTWVLTEKKRFCGDNWKANRIGQDVFKRG